MFFDMVDITLYEIFVLLFAFLKAYELLSCFYVYH